MSNVIFKKMVSKKVKVADQNMSVPSVEQSRGNLAYCIFYLISVRSKYKLVHTEIHMIREEKKRKDLLTYVSAF